MTVAAPADDAMTVGAAPAGPRLRWVLHAGAGLVVVLGVVAEIARPLAPDLGAPPAATGVFDAQLLARAAAYRGPLYVATFAAMAIRVAIAAAVAVTPAGRRLVDRAVDRIGAQRPARAAAVVVLSVVVATDLVLFPLTFWAGFVHDGAYGLRSQGFAGWLRDWAVFHVPVWGAVGVLALLGYTLARRLPITWPAVVGSAAGALGIAVAFASPLVLEPLAFDFRTLPAGPVRAEVERVLDAAGERVDTIVVADASRRSVRQNAYVSGLGASRRMVLYDTLVDERPVDEVGVVVAHELAHHRHRDLPRTNLFAAAGAVVVAYAVAAFVRRRTARGRQTAAHDPRGAAAVLLLVLSLNLASIPLQSFVSRRAEAAADLAALEYTNAPDVFERMQVGLTRTNLGEPQPPAVIAWWFGTHPTPMARIGMARWWAAR